MAHRTIKTSYANLNEWQKIADTKIEIFEDSDKGEWGYRVFISFVRNNGYQRNSRFL